MYEYKIRLLVKKAKSEIKLRNQYLNKQDGTGQRQEKNFKHLCFIEVANLFVLDLFYFEK